MDDGISVVAVKFRNSNNWRITALDEESIALLVQHDIDRGMPEEQQQICFLVELTTKGE